MVKRFLDSRQAAYELRDLRHDETAVVEFVRLGGRLPPLLQIGDRVIEGFRPDEIDEALAEFEPGATGENEEGSDGTRPKAAE